MSTEPVPIVAEIGCRTITRDELLGYEDRRINAAAKKLGIVPPPHGNIAERREAFLHNKLALGSDEILRRLKRDRTLAAAVTEAAANFSAHRRICVTDLHVPSGSAQQFIDFYWQCFHNNDERTLLAAHPDHFIYRVAPDGRHEVLETTGGSPLAGHFFLDYHDTSNLMTPIDPAFPGQIAAVARVGDTAIGGARHQFRDTATGFHARLIVEFPLPSIGRMISGHRWHLAAEFANWIEASISQGPSATELQIGSRPTSVRPESHLHGTNLHNRTVLRSAQG